eukprot:717173-Pelagomonas_calceolata.AAC.3
MALVAGCGMDDDQVARDEVDRRIVTGGGMEDDLMAGGGMDDVQTVGDEVAWMRGVRRGECMDKWKDMAWVKVKWQETA